MVRALARDDPRGSSLFPSIRELVWGAAAVVKDLGGKTAISTPICRELYSD